MIDEILAARNHPARRRLAHNVNVGTWRFVIHFADCPSHLRSDERNRGVPVSPGMRLVVCGHCCPPEHLVGPYLKTVPIYEHAHGFYISSRQRAIGP